MKYEQLKEILQATESLWYCCGRMECDLCHNDFWLFELELIGTQYLCFKCK